MGTCAGLRKRVRELEAAVFGLAAPEVEQIFGRIGRESHVSFGVDLASGKDRTAFMFVGSRHAALMREAMKVQESAGNTSQDKVEAGPVFASANAATTEQLELIANLRKERSQAVDNYYEQTSTVREQKQVIDHLGDRVVKLRELVGAVESGPAYRPFGGYAGSPGVCVGDVVWYGGEERSVKRVGVGVVMTCSVEGAISVPFGAVVKYGLKRI